MSARVFVCVVRGFLKEIVNRLQKSGKASRNLAIETCFPLQKLMPTPLVLENEFDSASVTGNHRCVLQQQQQQ